MVYPRLFRSVMAVLGIILASPAPKALASADLAFQWMQVLVRRIEPTYRELYLIDYRSGLTPSGYHVPGSVNLRDFTVGDHVLARVGLNNHLILEIRKTPPPTGDRRYQEVLRRILAEAEDRARER